MNVEIGTEAAQFPEKDYINGIFVAVQLMITSKAKLPEIIKKCYISYIEYSIYEIVEGGLIRTAKTSLLYILDSLFLDFLRLKGLKM
jgi:hypothetical protein